MKKIALASSLLLVLSLFPLPNKAEAITRGEIVSLRPELTRALSSLTVANTNIQARMNTENALFRQYSALLGTISVRLNSAPPPSTQELANLKRTLDDMKRLLAQSESWRAEVKTRMVNISGILRNISNLIAKAA